MLATKHTRRDILLAALLGSAATAVGGRAARAANRALDLGLNARALDVRACGAAGNGHDLDTAAINRAIATVSRKGGGVVRIPAGDYLCDTIHLQNGVTILLESGAVLRAAPPGNYDLVEPNRWSQYQDYGHDHWRNSLIYGRGVSDVAIEGAGLICGNGLSRGGWSDGYRQSRGVADKIIALKECRNVSLSGFNIVGSAHFGILATGVSNLDIRRLLVDTGRDGIDIDCCDHVGIADSCFNTPYDDSIAIKSSAALGYRRPTTNVRVTGCLVTGGFAPGTVFDGRRVPIGAAEGMKARIKIGTESCWGFDDIAIEGCVVSDALGIPLLTVDGGALTNVAIRDVVMDNIQDSPLFLRLGARLRALPGAEVRDFRDVTVENLKCYGFKMPIMVCGIPDHRIANVALRNIELVERHDAGADKGGGWVAVDEAAAQLPATEPPENERAYPEVGMFGPVPAKLMFARHVEELEVDGLSLRKVKADRDVRGATADRRPLFWLQDMADERFAKVEVPGGHGGPVCRSDRPVDFAVTVGDDLESPPQWRADGAPPRGAPNALFTPAHLAAANARS